MTKWQRRLAHAWGWMAAIAPMGQVMATTKVTPTPMGISFRVGGGSPGYNYYTNLGASAHGHYSLTVADTASSDDYIGVGTFEGTATDEDSADIAEVVHLLCQPGTQLKESPDGMTMGQVQTMPTADYRADCADGTSHGGTMFLAPKAVSDRARDILYKLAKSFYAHGDKSVKLDIEVVDVKPAPHNFLVTVRFINSGTKPLSFPSPAGWSGNIPDDSLQVGGMNPLYAGRGDTSHPGGYEFVFTHSTMVNASDYPESIVRIAPGDHRDAVFLAAPDGKYTHGTFDFGAIVYLQLTVDGKEFGPANFSSATRKRLTIDRDYPATLQEAEEVEAYHRKLMELRPVMVGHLIPEDGFYRPTANYEKIRGRFVTLFRVGMKAPKIVMQQAEDGTVLGPDPDAWIWAAEASSVIEGFGMHPCPKSGRWLAKIPNDVPNASYFLSRTTIMQLKQGERIPSIGLASAEDEARVRWEWIGP
jgi:hypothetical protein